MTAYQVWIHKREGWEFIVRLEDGRVTGVCDPAHALEAGEVQRFPYLEYATDDTSLYRFVEHPEQFAKPAGLRLEPEARGKPRRRRWWGRGASR